MLENFAKYFILLIIPGTYPTVKVPPTGTAGKWCTFEVAMSGGAESNIRVEIHGPSKSEVDINYHSTESATVRYRLEQPGEYYITIFFNNEPMNGCPFKTVIEPAEEGVLWWLVESDIELYRSMQ